MIGIVMIVIGVFVSNERDREMRGSSAQGAELDSLRWNSSFRESRTVKRNYSQLSGRTLNDPSAPERRVSAYLEFSTGRDCRRMNFCCLSFEAIRTLLEFLCGDRIWGARRHQLSGWEQRSMFLFGARDPEVKISLPHLPPRCCLRER